MRQWTAEERQRQAEKIRQWQPWKKGGVKTPEGKAKSRMNALKHGGYSRQMKTLRHFLRESRRLLLALAAAKRRPQPGSSGSQTAVRKESINRTGRKENSALHGALSYVTVAAGLNS